MMTNFWNKECGSLVNEEQNEVAHVKGSQVDAIRLTNSDIPGICVQSEKEVKNEIIDNEDIVDNEELQGDQFKNSTLKQETEWLKNEQENTAVINLNLENEISGFCREEVCETISAFNILKSEDDIPESLSRCEKDAVALNLKEEVSEVIKENGEYSAIIKVENDGLELNETNASQNTELPEYYNNSIEARLILRQGRGVLQDGEDGVNDSRINLKQEDADALDSEMSTCFDIVTVKQERDSDDEGNGVTSDVNHDEDFKNIPIKVADEPVEKGADETPQRSFQYTYTTFGQFAGQIIEPGVEASDRLPIRYTNYCEPCRSFFDRLSSLESHVKEVHQLVACSLCKQQFTGALLLMSHENYCTKRKKKLRQCQKCSKICINKLDLDIHKKFDHRRIYKCTPCRLRFYNLKSLDYHKRIKHRAVKTKVTCDLCGKEYSCQYHLEVHMRDHTGEKPYKCHHCEERFKIKTVLNTHLHCVHGIYKANYCICGAAFQFCRELKVHFLTTHSTRAHDVKCELCQKEFANEFSLMSHMMVVHDKGVKTDRPARKMNISQ